VNIVELTHTELVLAMLAMLARNNDFDLCYATTHSWINAYDTAKKMFFIRLMMFPG
jgi:hypothetical protein